MNNLDPYSQIASFIIKEQASIIGPVALEQARKVNGLEIVSDDTVKVSGNGKEILQHLVEQYSMLFGQASVEVCREALHDAKVSLPKEELPEILQ